jgi:hypothetical protein
MSSVALPLLIQARLRRLGLDRPTGTGLYFSTPAHRALNRIEGPVWETVQALLESDPGVYSVQELPHDRYVGRLVMAPGEVPTSAQITQEVVEASGGTLSPAVAHLTATVLAKGEVSGHYGSTAWDWPSLHVLVCGAQHYPAVDSDVMSEFDSMATSPDTKDVLSVWLQCRCKQSVRSQFVVEPPSLSELLCALSAETIDKLF